MTKTVIIIAPFWHESGHVGNYRIERFIRWFTGSGIHVVLVSAGSADREAQQPWGLELTIRDPVGLYRDTEPSGESPKPRKPNKLRRALALWLFNPDIGVVWANRVAKHAKVLQHAAGAEFVLSSSRPESAHVASWRLAKQLNCKLVIDMRDGWLDEPLEPLLMTSSIRRFVEGRLEKKILAAAEQIFVTSEVWRELLVARGVAKAERVAVITNAYPDFDFSTVAAESSKHKNRHPIELLHTGRFRASRSSQDPALLLEPLRIGLAGRDLKGSINLLGQLDAEEQVEIENYGPKMAAVGWGLVCHTPVSRSEAMTRVGQADGLLLLCAAYAAIPSKVFEYIPAKRPLLIVAKPGSAIWRVGMNIKQATLLDYSQPDTWREAIELFLNMLNSNQYESSCPEIYSDAYLGKLAMASLGLALTKVATH
ncbi:MAG: glycosyltransferase [Methylococcales bacterium]